MPGRFNIARSLGPSYYLRCVVFHNISPNESLFTKGMRVSINPGDFEAALKFLTKYYSPVCLEDVLAYSEGCSLPPRAVLVTFDDGYASIMEWAATLCAKLGVPAIFFLNAAFLDNHRLAPDNLVCYVANTLGMEAITTAARAIKRTDIPRLKSLADVFSCLFPSISLGERQVFLDTLTELGRIDERILAEGAGLYMTRTQVRKLACMGFEIGSHTYTHVHCRSLSPQSLDQEIARNKTELQRLSGKEVRSFSLPYGSSVDLTNDLVEYLKFSGHEAVFLSESVANRYGTDRFHLDRVSAHAPDHDGLFFEIEVLPRLRAIRNCFSPHFRSVRPWRTPLPRDPMAGTEN